MIEDDEMPPAQFQPGRPRRDAARWLAADALRCLTSLPVVGLVVDGVRMLAIFEPDPEEHTRRSALELGAVTSTALLHGLWLLPSGVPVPMYAVPDHKRRRLESARHLVEVADGCFERLYAPAGAVRVVAFQGTRASRSVKRAARFTPIVQRVALCEGRMQPSSDVLRAAVSWGVGLVQYADRSAKVLVDPPVPELGVPAVYRWWIAELAYSSWLYESAQPVS
jgi:hypothetical protein